MALDGDLSEWTLVDRLDSGDNGVAGYELYGRLEAGAFLFALRAPIAIGANTTFWLNTDQDPATGFLVFGSTVGAEFNINFDVAGVPLLHTGAAGETPVLGPIVDYVYSADGLSIELAVDADALAGGGAAPTALNLYVDVNDATFLPVDYAGAGFAVAAPAEPTIVGSVTLDGALDDWGSTERIDISGAVDGFEIYGKATGDSYVFAIRAPADVIIGAATTAWLNTDLDAATGFQIFGATGGAEFNINFDASGTPFLYTGDAGEALVSATPLAFGRSAEGNVIEFAVGNADIGAPTAIGTLFDVNNVTFLPENYAGTQFEVFGDLPARTEFDKKVAIVYSETTAALFFGTPDVNINETAYSQLFMAAQNQAAMAGVPYDLLNEADLKDLAKLVNYDAIVFPAFEFVKADDAAIISDNLTLLARFYNTSVIAAGNFMTNDETGAILPGDAYATMRAVFDLAPVGSGFPVDVTVTSTGTGFAGVGGYTAGEVIEDYDGIGTLAFDDNTPTTSPLTVVAEQTFGGQTAAAIVVSEATGDRNVHFATASLLADNNQLWQAIEHAVNGGAGPSVGLQLSRQSAIVASRVDMDQSQFSDQVDPAGGAPGIYDQMIPIVEQWKDTYGFVASYYINVGDNPTSNQETIWSVSLPYYQTLLSMGNEIGSHSLTHLPGVNDTNQLVAGTGPGTFDYEFRLSRDLIQDNIDNAVPGFQIVGAAVPGQPEYLATSEQIIEYYSYLTGGYSAQGAGFPGAFGYLTPEQGDLGKVYLAPSMKFDFTLIEFEGLSNEQAVAAWQAEFAELTSKAEVPIVVWPWHDYGPTNWNVDPPFFYETGTFETVIATASNAGSEFVTLADLADRIRSFETTVLTSTVAGDVVTVTAAPAAGASLGRFALDIDNLGGNVIQSVDGWYAYDADSVFTDRDGGTYTIALGAAAADVTHITALPMRAELISLTGDGTNLSFQVIGEGQVVIDLKSLPGVAAQVAGASIVSQVGEILTLDLGGLGTHDVGVILSVNSGPQVVAANLEVAPGVLLDASSLFSAIDPEGDALTIRLLDGTDDPTSGQFLLNGVAQQAGLVVELAATDLGTLQFQTAPGVSTDQLSVSANDGSGWTEPVPFTITTTVSEPGEQRAITVTFQSESAGYRSSLGWYDTTTGAGAILFGDIEAAGGAPTVVNGVTQVAFTVPATAVADIAYFIIPDGGALNAAPSGPVNVVQLAGGAWAVAPAGGGTPYAGAGTAALFTEAARNPGGVPAAVLDASGTIAWEDIAASANAQGAFGEPGDADYNDLVVSVSLQEGDGNTPPGARDDRFSTQESSPVAGNVLANNGSGADIDPDGDPLLVTALNGDAAAVGVPVILSSGAIVTLNADGTFDFNPNGAFDALNAGEVAQDTFAYTVSDGRGGSDDATVTLAISGQSEGGADTTTLLVTFISESAGYRSSLGWYDMSTGQGEIVFSSIEADGGAATVIAGVTQVGFDVPTDRVADVGFFLIPDGGSQSTVPSGAIEVVQTSSGAWAVAPLGGGTPFEGAGAPALFTETAKNVGGVDYASVSVGSGQTAATLGGDTADGPTGRIAWEDIPASPDGQGGFSPPGDADYNDLVVEVTAILAATTVAGDSGLLI